MNTEHTYPLFDRSVSYFIASEHTSTHQWFTGLTRYPPFPCAARGCGRIYRCRAHWTKLFSVQTHRTHISLISTSFAASIRQQAVKRRIRNCDLHLLRCWNASREEINRGKKTTQTRIERIYISIGNMFQCLQNLTDVLTLFRCLIEVPYAYGRAIGFMARSISIEIVDLSNETRTV